MFVPGTKVSTPVLAMEISFAPGGGSVENPIPSPATNVTVPVKVSPAASRDTTPVLLKTNCPGDPVATSIPVPFSKVIVPVTKESPFVKDTALILRKCRKCNFKDAWARPPFQNPFPLDVNWAEKTFFTVRK
jgi:hypothetical protein